MKPENFLSFPFLRRLHDPSTFENRHVKNLKVKLRGAKLLNLKRQTFEVV